MSDFDSLIDLIRKGDEILRIPRPPLRQRQWRRWRDQVVNTMQDIPALKKIGLHLEVNYLAADVGILSRYLRLTTQKPKVAEKIAISERRTKGRRHKSKKPYSKDTDKIKIFISHKHEDERTAIGVKAAIERYGAGRVEIFISEDIPGGVNWNNWIKRRLSEAQILILIFTDITKTWDWPLYEAGLFTKLDGAENQKLICLHSENLDPPAPLLHLQAVPAKILKVKKFLKELFIETKLIKMSKPLNPAMANQPEELDRAAKEIVDLISRKKIHINYFSKYLFLSIGYLENGKIPGDSKVLSDASSLEIFGLKEGNWVWEDIIAKAKKDEDQRWLNELINAISDAIKGQIFTPIQASLKSNRENKRYLPLLYRVDTLADGSHIAKILFNEDVSWHISDIPKALGFLSTALVMSVRFRYEILHKFEGKHIYCRSQRAKNKLNKLLLQSLKNIEMESSSRGLLDEEKLINVFNKQEDKLKIKKMYDSWYQIRNYLFSRKKKKEDIIAKQLNTLFDLNNEFITMGMKRFCELLTQER